MLGIKSGTNIRQGPGGPFGVGSFELGFER